jgi:hypothetical protein
LKVEKLNAKYIKGGESSLRSEDDVDDFSVFWGKVRKGVKPSF